MCIIAAKPAGVKWLSEELMQNCFIANDDGAGFAWVDDDGLQIEKGYFDWDSLWYDLQLVEPYPVLLHFRLATHGKVKKSNCHPFMFKDINKNNIAMAHNGVINIEPNKGKTDSETFGLKYLHNHNVYNKNYIRLLEMAISSSKIAMLNEKGKFIILNQKAGNVKNGIWFSNKSYESKSDSYLYNYQYNSKTYSPYLDSKFYKEHIIDKNAIDKNVIDKNIGGLSDLCINDPFFADYCLSRAS